MIKYLSLNTYEFEIVDKCYYFKILPFGAYMYTSEIYYVNQTFNKNRRKIIVFWLYSWPGVFCKI